MSTPVFASRLENLVLANVAEGMSQEDSDTDSHDDCYDVLDARSCRCRVWRFITADTSLPWGAQMAAFVYQLTFAVYVVAMIVVDSRTDFWVTTSEYWHMELVGLFVWTIEYCLRLWSCVEASEDQLDCGEAVCFRLRFMVRPMMLIDLVSLIALVVDLHIPTNRLRGASSLRMLRLVTLFRIERDFNFFGPVFAVVYLKRLQLLGTLGIAGTVLLVSAVIMFYVEAPSNANFDSVLKSMWWATTALTTVGYGDVVPETGIGRAVASVVAFLGIGMFALPAGIVASGFQEYADNLAALKLSRAMAKEGGAGRARQAAHSLQSHPLEDLLERFEQALEATERRLNARMDELQSEVVALRLEARSPQRI
eukprot:TRINITY_DN29473_c0_g1_i1.p1 TRINITY_DN29473_c0_g1~~TRINITY_DN29473_c0_g1_i1.p1  ORF type:complete len:411 (-),score=34.56 TRINITY_DN29473_c0_g1_i1:542-1642(-)